MASASRSARDTAKGWRDGGSIDDGVAEVELSLRLRTGSSSSSSSAARRSMTIFYNGRVCAVDVTELQAREIIAMASQQILTEQQDSSGGGGTAVAQCRAHQDANQPTTQRSAPLLASRPLRQGLGAAAVIRQAPAAGLSMKRSLQQFLQKRKTRVAAMGSPYAGGRPVMPSLS